jgi:PAS domain S-box-containing protein
MAMLHGAAGEGGAPRLEIGAGRCRAIVEQAVDGFATFDATGRIDYVNARFAEWMEAPAEGLLGRHVDELNPFDLGDPGAFWEWLRSGGSCEREVQRRDERGQVRWARATASPLRTAGAAVSHWVLQIQDVTERKALEEQLLHSHRLESIGTLAGGIAHDFNNILTGLIGIAADLRDDADEGSALARDLDRLLGLLRRAGGLTQSLLTFARKRPATLFPEALASVVEGVTQLVGRTIGEDIALEVVPPPPDLVVEVDRGQAEQVLLNLVTNARDAMPRGGRLTISGRSLELDLVDAERHGVPPGRYAVLSVEDTGVGMEPEVRERIFDPFFTTKEVGKGTGLGLSIVYGIVKQHRGFIDVWSEPGKGTRFDVHLPARAGGAPRRAERAAAPRGQGERILLAEDDPAVREVWTSLLRRHGYEVVAVADGEAAVERFQADPAMDLVLMDVTMPHLGGADAEAELRRIDPAVRVLFASGYPARDGVDPVPEERLIHKPVAPAELLSAIRTALDGMAEA